MRTARHNVDGGRQNRRVFAQGVAGWIDRYPGRTRTRTLREPLYGFIYTLSFFTSGVCLLIYLSVFLPSLQHPFAPGTHYQYKPGNDKNLKWYEDYNKEWGILGGADCCSPDSVSFHYIKKAPIVRHIYKILYDLEACPRNTL